MDAHKMKLTYVGNAICSAPLQMQQSCQCLPGKPFNQVKTRRIIPIYFFYPHCLFRFLISLEVHVCLALTFARKVRPSGCQKSVRTHWDCERLDTLKGSPGHIWKDNLKRHKSVENFWHFITFLNPPPILKLTTGITRPPGISLSWRGFGQLKSHCVLFWPVWPVWKAGRLGKCQLHSGL